MSDTPTLAPPAAPPSAARAEALGHRTLTGLLFMLAQTVGLKLVGFVGTLILGRLLLKEDFGVFYLATTIATFTDLLRQAGLRQALIQRHQTFQRWANAGFWISLAFGLVSAFAILLIAASTAVANPRLAGALAILAISSAIGPLSIVPAAWFEVHLRFRVVAAVGFWMGVLTILLSITLAYYGYGAYALILPRPIVALVQVIVLWSFVPIRIRPRLQLYRWRFLLNTSLILLATCFLGTILQVENLVLKFFHHGEDVVGTYGFGYGLSMHASQIISASLVAVLFSPLSKLHAEPARQTHAFLSATRLIAIVGTPLCMLQALLAPPLIEAFFHHKWDDAIPVFQILSLGTIFILASGPAAAMIQAQRRYWFFFWWSLLCALAFLAMVGIGAMFGGPSSVALAVAVFFLIFGPMGYYVSIQSPDIGPMVLWHTFGIPVLAGILTLLPAFLVGYTLLATQGHPLYLLLTSLLGLLAYPCVIYLWARKDFADLRNVIRTTTDLVWAKVSRT